MAQYDAIVIGAGIVGSATAYSLTRRGCSTLLLEQFALPHTRGSSHGQSRLIRKANQHPYQVKMMEEAYEMWAQLEKETHTKLIKRTGLLMFGDADIDHIRQVERSLVGLKSPYRRYNTNELREKFPMFRFESGQVGIYDETAGVIRADVALLSYQAAFKNNGGTLRDEEVVDSVIPGDIVTVKTSKGEYTAKSIVITTGPWTPKITQSLGLRLPLQVLHTNVFYLKQRENIHTVDAGMPCFMYIHSDMDKYECPRNMYGFPCSEYPNQVKVGCYGGPLLNDPDFRDVSSPLDQTAVKTVEEFTQRYLPAVIPKVGIVERCMLTITPDANIILDVHPRWKNIVIGAGFSGHGFKMCPVIGKVLAELATDGQPSYDLRLFTMDRFGADVTKARSALNGDCKLENCSPFSPLDDCTTFTIEVATERDVEADGQKANYPAADDNLSAVTAEREPLAAAAPFSGSDIRRQKPFELPKLRTEHTARIFESLTTSASSIMERSSRNKQINAVKKLHDQRAEQKQPRNALTSREKVAVTAGKRRKWQRGIVGMKRYTNNGKAKRDAGPVKLPAEQQPYLSDPTRPSVLPRDVSSLRWEFELDDPQDEADRLLVYKTNRRKRYLAAANMALDKYSATKRTTSPTTSSLTSLSSPEESVETTRSLPVPRPTDGSVFLPRIPGVDRLYPARTATPKLLVGCS